MCPSRLAWALALAASGALGQLAPVDPDWRELEAPPPPQFKQEGLIPLDVPRATLHFGVDPDSIAIGNDSIVRYVVVATGSGGAVNGLYEALRCNTGEFKVYARYNPGTGWTIAKDAQWRPLHGAPGSPHSLAMARYGACVGRAPNRSPQQIARDLRAPADRRFNQPQ